AMKSKSSVFPPGPVFPPAAAARSDRASGRDPGTGAEEGRPGGTAAVDAEKGWGTPFPDTEATGFGAGARSSTEGRPRMMGPDKRPVVRSASWPVAAVAESSQESTRGLARRTAWSEVGAVKRAAVAFAPSA